MPAYVAGCVREITRHQQPSADAIMNRNFPELAGTLHYCKARAFRRQDKLDRYGIQLEPIQDGVILHVPNLNAILESREDFIGPWMECQSSAGHTAQQEQATSGFRIPHLPIPGLAFDQVSPNGYEFSIVTPTRAVSHEIGAGGQRRKQSLVGHRVNLDRSGTAGSGDSFKGRIELGQSIIRGERQLALEA